MERTLPNGIVAKRNYAEAELLVQPDGGILVHNLTPALALLLAELNPAEPTLARRVNRTMASLPQHGQHPTTNR